MPIKFHSEIEQYNLKIQKGRLVVAHYRDATLKQTILPGMKFALADFLQLNRANLKKKSGYFNLQAHAASFQLQRQITPIAKSGFMRS
jgi:hypothetical protein